MSPFSLAVSPAALPLPPSNALFMSRQGKNKINNFQLQNRILALMAHTTYYAFKGGTRLAQDAGVSKSAVCRLLNGHSSPSFALVAAITQALEKRLGRPLDPRDLISLNGDYPTASACELAGCKGCLPSQAYDENNCLRNEYKNVKPGQWSAVPRVTSSAKSEEEVK